MTGVIPQVCAREETWRGDKCVHLWGPGISLLDDYRFPGGEWKEMHC